MKAKHSDTGKPYELRDIENAATLVVSVENFFLLKVPVA
jgi:hypothetical protein